MITFEGVTKRYPGGTLAVDDLNLEIPDGQTMVLVGPSGCGKTTTLRMINRLIDPTSGRILLDGRDIQQSDPPTLRRGIGYVIQQAGLFPHRTIEDNIGTVPLLHRLGQGQGQGPGPGADAAGRPGRQPGPPLPVPALRRPAAARRGGPGAGRRPAGAADGRAVQRR